jgi:hypothetical protein
MAGGYLEILGPPVRYQKGCVGFNLMSSFRHPNFVQIFAAASSSGIHAIVAHQGSFVSIYPRWHVMYGWPYIDLVPFHDFFALYRHSPILTVYILASCVGPIWHLSFFAY